MLSKENKELRKQLQMFQQEVLGDMVSAENNNMLGLNDSAKTIKLQN